MDQTGYAIALEEARKGLSVGGIPIGSALVSKDGKVLGRGHNQRIQKGSTILHAETDALENAGTQPADVYASATLYTTLSPCQLCTGACLLYGIKRLVVGDNTTYMGGEEYLKSQGVEVINLNDPESKQMMEEFIKKEPEIWFDVVPTTRPSS